MFTNDLLFVIDEKIKNALRQNELGDFMSFKQLEGGISVPTYLVQTTKHPIVLRFYGNKYHDPNYENLIYSKLNQVGYPVPKVYYFEPKKPQFLLLEYFPEGTLGERYFRSGKFTEHDLHQYLKNLTILHGLDWKELFPRTNINYIQKHPSNFAKTLIKRLSKEIKQSRSKKQTSDVMSWLNSNYNLQITGSLHFLHGDYHPLNILVREESQVPIDYEGAEIGDIRYDLSFALTSISVDQPIHIISNYLKMYNEHAKTTYEFENLDFFMVCGLLHRVIRINNMLKSGVQNSLLTSTYYYLIHVIEELTGQDLRFSLY